VAATVFIRADRQIKKSSERRAATVFSAGYYSQTTIFLYAGNFPEIDKYGKTKNDGIELDAQNEPKQCIF
jgi:hypothetical protein